MYKIIGNYQGNTQDEIIDEDDRLVQIGGRLIVDKWGNED
jgi:hypothetical protein